MRINHTAKVWIILALLISMMLFPGSAWAEEVSTSSDQPVLAPLDPDFIKFLEDSGMDTINEIDEDAHPKGYIPEPLERIQSEDDQLVVQDSSLPLVFDLRTTGQLTAVKNQGAFGSCWTFATYASLESYLKKQVATDLSENNLMWNHGFDLAPNDGGNTSMSTAYLSRWSGPIDESNDPYGTVKKTGLTPSYHIQEVENIPSSQTAIKQALLEGGALAMSMNADAFDSSAYYNSAKSALYYNGNSATNHAVTIVGWDDNFDRNNFNTIPPGNGAWIIRNSWGANWGEQGYFYMSYYDTYAGYKVTAFHNAESTYNYKDIYQYDLLGATSSTGYGKNDAWGANVFTAIENDMLTAVSTYTRTANTAITIKIYTNVIDGQPTSGVLKATKLVNIPRDGYHTIDLDAPVELINGQKFSVVIEYNTPGYNYPVPLEVAYENYCSAVTANPGESYLSSNGTLWSDISQSSDRNVCIKAFTKNEKAILEGLLITALPTKQNYLVGETLDISGLEVSGIYSDGTTKIETITMDNITGFDSSKAATDQVLTVNIQGKTTTFEIQIFSIPEFEVKSFTAMPENKQYLNTAIQLAAEGAEGKTPYQYQFSSTLDGVKTVARAYSTTATASFTPTKAGTYTLTVDVKDASGAVVTKNIEDFSVVANPTVASFTTDKDSGQTASETITLTAEGSDGMAPYTYRFYSKLGTVTTILKEYDIDGNSATFIPATPGSYTLGVDLKDAGGKVVTKTITNYTIGGALSVKTLTTDKTSGQGVGTAIKLTASGSDGTAPYQYTFYTIRGDKTTTIQDYSAADSASFTPTETGSYTLGVTIKDKNGKTAYKTISDYEIVEGPGLASFSANPESTQYLNTAVQLAATGTGGKSPYQYQFSTTLNGVKTVVKAYSNASTASFTPTKTGNYTLTVELKDANGNIGTRTIDTYTVVANPTVSSFTTDKVSGQITGTGITLTATGSDGKAPYSYKFYTKLGTVTTILKDYSEAGNTASFTPDKVGLYTLCVDIKDAGGKTATKSIASYAVVNPLNVKSFTTGKASGQAIGTSIPLTALGSDGKAPYQYQFSYTLDSATTIIKGYSTTASASFIPATAGDYTLTVELKDAAGNTATRTISPYTILADPIIDSFTATAPNGQGVNTSINLAASGSSGKAPYQYKFYWKKGTVTTIIQNFGTASSATFKPTAVGTYTLCVDIKDANGRIGTKTIDSYEIYGAPTVKSLVTDKASGQYEGTDIILTALGSDGKAPYTYKFYSKLGTATTILKEYEEAGNTATFTPASAGAYSLGVDVKDANGIVTTKTIANYTVIANPSVKSFTPGKVSGQAIATAIPLTALGTGGKAPYQYQFSHTLAGKTTLIKDYSTLATATFTPGEAGSYALTVTIKDASGKTATQTIDPYTILPDPVVDSFTADAPNGSGVNTGIVLSATGSCGKCPYQYQFYTKQGTTKVVIRPFTVTNTATFKPIKAGVYDLYVDIKDTNGRIATQSISGYTIYTGPTVTSLTADKASGQYVDTAINLTAAATGGTGPYTYDFYCKLGIATDRISIHPEGDQNTATFTPTTAGIYTLCVDVKDANGIIASKTLANYKVIANPRVKSFIASKTSGQPVNTSIILTAQGTDGKTPYQYKFSYSDGTTTTTIRDYSTLTTAIFKPTKAGIYTLTVEMKDGGGKTATQTIDNFEIK